MDVCEWMVEIRGHNARDVQFTRPSTCKHVSDRCVYIRPMANDGDLPPVDSGNDSSDPSGVTPEATAEVAALLDGARPGPLLAALGLGMLSLAQSAWFWSRGLAGLEQYRSPYTDLPHALWTARLGELMAVDGLPVEPLYVRDAGATLPTLPPSPLG